MLEGESIKVLIDDDKLIHMSWQMAARKADVELKTFFSVDEFLESCECISQQTEIFIDSNLADGKRGEIESEKIFNAGFEELFLSTGYNSEDIQRPEWIKAVTGKRPEFN